MAERHAYIKCKICGAHHRGVEHDWGSKPSAPSIIDVTPRKLPPPTIAEIKKATADLERAFPADSPALPVHQTAKRVPKAAVSVAGKSTPATAAPGKLKVARKALAVAEAKPARKRKAKPMTEAPKKPATGKRGRPATGFDKKEHDRKKSADRRAALKAAKS